MRGRVPCRRVACGLLSSLLGCREGTAGEAMNETRAAAALAAPAPAGSAAGSAGSLVGAARPELRIIGVERPCMGTRCTLSAYHWDPVLVERAIAAAVLEINRLDALMSNWVQTSDVSRINAVAGSGEWIDVAPETFQVLTESAWIAEQSGGAFDITVGAFKGLWKFDEDNDGTIPKRADVLARLPYIDYRGVLLDPAGRRARLARKGQSITLGGIAKGLVVDRAVAKLREAGLRDFLVQAGGDLYASGRHGDRDWKVGIQDPRAGTEKGRSGDTSFALLTLSNSAFNTSGDYERFVIRDGRRYHHILDPRTGYPVEHTRSVTVLAATSFLADTLDTALFVLGADKGLALIARLPGVEAVIVDSSNQVHTSPGLTGKLQLLRPPTDQL
jgi:thiamine biosynthesis lipoprotein